MSRPEVMAADVERAVADYLSVAMADETNTTIKVGIDADFRPSSTASAIQIDSFIADMSWPIATRPTVRLVAYSTSTTESKRLAAKAVGLLYAHDGAAAGIGQVVPTTGPDPARDDRTHAELAACEVQVAIRTIPIT